MHFSITAESLWRKIGTSLAPVVVDVRRPEAVAAIHEAKAAGCLLAILSNELDLFYGADFRGRLPLLKQFDLIVDASHTGILKPDLRAYEMCSTALKVPARDCVFVDDQLRNIVGAQNAGWQTVHFDVMAPDASYEKALNLLNLR